MLRIATVNVNGIRAAERRGFGTWLAARGCDIVAIQEMRCPADQVPAAVFDGWQLAYNPGVLAGRNGVAIASRVAPTAVRVGFGDATFDPEGRYIEADFDLADCALTIGCLYLPKGATVDTDLAKYQRKMTFMSVFAKYVTTARQTALDANRQFLIMGDFNIAHTKLDVKNWRGNQKNEGFLPEEREWLGQQLSPDTLVDVVRNLHPDVEGPYSWWSWRGQAFSNDTGWRIDYHLATPDLAASAIAGGTDRENSYEARMSDHAPVVVDYSNIAATS